MTATRDRRSLSARLHAQLDELHAADLRLRARQREAWAAYVDEVEALLAAAHADEPHAEGERDENEGDEPEGEAETIAEVARELLEAYRARLDHARVQLHLGVVEAQELASGAIDALRERLPGR